jgi:hypothetical protein
MFVKSTSATVASAILVLVVTQQSATAKQQHARKYHPVTSQCNLLNSNAYAASGYTIKGFDGLQSLANGAQASGLAGH